MATEGLAFAAALRLGGLDLDAAFEVGRGEVLALVGPSGAGKSTCLSVIAGLRAPGTGRVECAGEVWCETALGIDLAPHRRHVGLLFQDFALFPHLRVADNVSYGARARGASRAEAARAAADWLERFGLSGLARERVTALAGGEKQRVALARALASGAKALLLDEPFAALDVATRTAVRGELRRHLAASGLPTVFVTHDPFDAVALGDRLAVLEGGRITQSGRHDQLALHPRTPFAAALAGLNFYRVEVAAGQGLKEARVGTVVFHVLADELSGPAAVAFGPAEVALSSMRPTGSAQNVFRGRVRERVPQADRVRVVLDVGVLLSAEVTREAAAALVLEPGQEAWASVKATAIRVCP